MPSAQPSFLIHSNKYLTIKIPAGGEKHRQKEGNMKKYEVLTDVFQEQGHFSKFGLSADDVIDLYNGKTFTDPKIESSFDTEAEARKYFEQCKNLAFSEDRDRYANFRIVILREEDFDDDDEPCGAEDLEFFAKPIKAYVIFEGGESRNRPGIAVDYMLVTLTDGTELYAEAEAVEGKDWANFDDLKTEILQQAEEKGISPDRLNFND
jgi:hypothetical protein